jgi:hypothetical protein
MVNVVMLAPRHSALRHLIQWAYLRHSAYMTFGIITFSILCYYAECSYAQCRDYLNVMLGVAIT